MQISGCAALAAVLIAGSAARAAELSAVVPGHPGVTYGTLLKQVMPGMQKNAAGGWDSGPVKHLRDLDGKPLQELEISFNGVDATTVREDGHKRLLLMTDENSSGSGFDAVLAAYDLDAKTPKLLDYVDAGRDNWQLGLFPEEAQRDVWGKDTSVLITSSYAPTGKVERVDGGFRLSGRWSFSSGCDHCQWVFLGGVAPSDGPIPDMRTFLLPRSDYRIIDNWHVAGLAGTGSKDIVVEGAFVPEHRTHRFVDAYMFQNPGQAVNTGPLFRLPFGCLFAFAIAVPAIGAARGGARARWSAPNIVLRGVRAVDLLFEASGGRALFLDNPMQRYFRDVHAMRAHALNNPDKVSQVFGYAELHPGGTPPEF
jgi:hypothetical protein